MKNSRLIVILGMHRSGTSAITRGLQVMGVSLGDSLIPAIEDINAKGFWEDIDLNALNTEMLRTLNSDWHYLVPIKSHDVEALHKAGFFLRAVELLRMKIGDSPLFAFKDPRVAKLLPFWKAVFSDCQLNVSYVLAVRHPISVAKSLLKRDGFDMGKSHLLWLGHVISSLSGTEGNKRVVVDYDRLMQSPERELHRIAQCLDLKIDPIELQSYKTEFLEQGLRHTVYDLSDLSLDNACPPLVREMYPTLVDVASDKTQLDASSVQEQISNWIDEFNRLNSQLLLSLVDRLYAQISERGRVVAERDAMIAERDAMIAERDAMIAERDAMIAERDATIHAFYTSRSWRLTRPLRFLARLIT